MPALIGGVVLSPCPLMSISEQHLTAPDGTYLGQTYQITLHGNLVTTPPDTTPPAIDASLGVLLAKQESLVEAFSTDGALFEVYSPDGSHIVQCNPKVISIDFTEGIWVQRTEYTVVLETNSLYAGDFVPSQYVTDIRNQWQIEEAGYTTVSGSSAFSPVWQLTHTVGATGKISYDINGGANVPWQDARDWVLNKLANDSFSTRPFNTSSELNLPSTNNQGYNYTRVEDTDEIAGSFNITEKWILAYGFPATETYTVSVHRIPADSITATVTIAGTIQGLSTGLNQLQTRIDNAIAYFNNSVKNNLLARASAAISDVTLSDYGVTGTLDYNYAEGTISYSYDYNNKDTPSGTDSVYDNYTISRKLGMEDVETTVTVAGTIIGRLRLSEAPSVLLRYSRAKTYWDSIYGTNTFLTRANLSGVVGLQPSTTQGSVDFNYNEGTISYSYDFNNRVNNLARNEYTMSVQTTREESRAVVKVEGTISGIRASENDPQTAKYTNALAFWATWQSQIYVTAVSFAPSSIVLNSKPVSVSRGDNTRQGTINYSYEYDTNPPPTIPGALSQQVTTAKTNATDVFAAITVLGRAAGPILQDIGTKKETSFSINLDYTMPLGVAEPNTDNVINSYMPDAGQVFLDKDESSFAPTTGKGTRSVTWVYQ